MKSRSWPCLLLLLAMACSKDDATKDDLWVYANRFFDEAAARNITLDKSNLVIRFVDASEITPYAGYGSPDPPLVRIVKSYWDGFNDTKKECLMFHELGHAILNRQHTYEKLPDCTHYKSMMTGDNLYVYDNSTDIKREYYINELFNPLTEWPQWSGPSRTNKTPVINNVYEGWQFVAVDGSIHVGTQESDSSFHIHSANAGTGQSFWALKVPFNDFPFLSTLAVNFKVRTSNVKGGSATVTLQSDLSKNPYFWTTTSQYYSLANTHDWSTFQIVLNCYPQDKPEMFIYLGLIGTASGDVWFKDVSLDYYN